jgi:hypothetical protein
MRIRPEDFEVSCPRKSEDSMSLAAGLLALALQDAPPFKQENTEANLKQLFERIHKAHSSGDDQAALALSTPLFPDAAALKKGMREGSAPELIAQAVEFYAKLIPADLAKRARLFRAGPANTEVRVYAATTEEIFKYEKGSVAFMQFPGGAQKLSDGILRPGTTYYEVVLAKPGDESGMKFHLFFWTGEGWSMLGPLWRAFR